MSEETERKKPRPRTPSVEAGQIYNQLKKIAEQEEAELKRCSPEAIREKHKLRREELLKDISPEVNELVKRLLGQP
jgi:hypothetical protein